LLWSPNCRSLRARNCGHSGLVGAILCAFTGYGHNAMREGPPETPGCSREVINLPQSITTNIFSLIDERPYLFMISNYFQLTPIIQMKLT